MMYHIKTRLNLSGVILVLAALVFSLVSPWMMSPAQAEPLEMNTFTSTIEFQDPPATVQVSDLSGNLVGEGEHGGRVRCFKNNCNKGTQLQLNGVEYRYRAKTVAVLDPEAEVVIVAGTGTIGSNGQKDVFSFTAIFQKNMDGTISVTYDASNSTASFLIPSTPGTITFTSK